MASININTNIGQVNALLQSRLKQLGNPETFLRPMCFDLIDIMTKRIHIDGVASDGTQIGTYSPGYMKVRTGNYGNSARVTRGPNKGNLKNAGVITRGPNKGQPRPRYNRSNDTKVIVSLTRQLENNWSVIATQRGYGIGFLNPFNYQKARWVEAQKKKEIFSLSQAETDYSIAFINEKTRETLNG